MSSQRPNHVTGPGPNGSQSQIQTRGIPTPYRLHGSPSRSNGNPGAEMMTPAPAGHARMKGRLFCQVQSLPQFAADTATLIVAKPQFGQLHNAFATPPTAILKLSKRARTDSSPSPSERNGTGTRTPTRNMCGEARVMSPSAKGSPQVSPSKERVGSPLVDMGEREEEMVMETEGDVNGGLDDWQPDFRAGVQVELDHAEEDGEVDDRSLVSLQSPSEAWQGMALTNE